MSDSLADLVAKLDADPSCSVADLLYPIPLPALLADLRTGKVEACNQPMEVLFGMPSSALLELPEGVDALAAPGHQSPSAWREEFAASGAASIELGEAEETPHLWIQHPTKLDTAGDPLLLPVNIHVQRINGTRMLATIQHQPVTAAALAAAETANAAAQAALADANLAHGAREIVTAELEAARLSFQATIAGDRDYYTTIALLAILIAVVALLALVSGITDSLQTFETLAAMLIGGVAAKSRQASVAS